jgi:5-methyltetrahydrofolate--homocysteine methyltransferase
MNDRDQILKDLYNSVIDGDAERAQQAAERSLQAGVAPLAVVDECLTPAIREVGERFSRMDMFLPEMVESAAAMEAAIKVLEPHFGAGDRAQKAKVVVGTVKGDIHDIGKNIAIALLKVNGFEVIDLGRDVPPSTFIDEAQKAGAQIIGMSALLTTSLPMMRDTINFMVQDGVRDKYKIIIGGGPTSAEYAKRIGADGYAENAYEGVVLCQRLLSDAAKPAEK